MGCKILLNLRAGKLGWFAFDSPQTTNLLLKKKWFAVWGVFKLWDCVLRGVAQVVFVNNPLSGLLILLGLFVADLTVGLATVYCTVIAFFVAKGVLDLPDCSLHAGLPLFSPVLVGSVTASLFTLFFHAPLTPVVWGYMAIASAFSVCVFAGLCHMLSVHNLPAYTLPFNIATALIFLGMRGAGYAYSPIMQDPDNDLENMTLYKTVHVGVEWDKVWLGALLSAGQVWAVENVTCSVLVLIAMSICSPLLTAACFVGGLLGTLTALELSHAPFTLVYAGVWGYNGFLAAGAIMYFAVASPRVVALAVINAVLATFIQAGLLPSFGQNGLPVFTFPFCLASFLLLAATSSSTSFTRVQSPTIPEIHLINDQKEQVNEEKRDDKEDIAITHMI